MAEQYGPRDASPDGMATHIHDDSPFRGEVEDRIPSWIVIMPPLFAAILAVIITMVAMQRSPYWG